MTNLMQYVDVCIGNEEDAEKVLGFKPGNTDVTSGELELAGYVDIFNQMADKSASSTLSVLCVKATALPTTAGPHASWMERPESSTTPENIISLRSLIV